MDKNELETIMEKLGMYGVLYLLAEIAYDKSEHLESNWQDRQGARKWQKAASLLSSLAFKISNLLD